jgi:hypothetical protein
MKWKKIKMRKGKEMNEREKLGKKIERGKGDENKKETRKEGLGDEEKIGKGEKKENWGKKVKFSLCLTN